MSSSNGAPSSSREHPPSSSRPVNQGALIVKVPKIGTVSALSMGLEGLGIQEIIAAEDLLEDTGNGAENVVMTQDVAGVIDFEDISELAEDEDEVCKMDEKMDDGSEALSIQSGELATDTFVLEQPKEGGESKTKKRSKFTDMMALSRSRKPHYYFRRVKFPKAPRMPTAPLPDESIEFLSWQVAPFVPQERKSSRTRVVLASDARKMGRLGKVQAALAAVCKSLPPLVEAEKPKDPLEKFRMPKPKHKLSLEEKRLYLPINLVDWEHRTGLTKPNLTPFYAAIPQHDHLTAAIHRIKNRDVESGKWIDAVIYDPRKVTPAAFANTRLQLPLSDPFLCFEMHEPETLHSQLSRAEKLIAQRLKKLRKQQAKESKTPLMVASGQSTPSLISKAPSAPINYTKCLPNDRFNLSCDRFYEKRRRSLGAVIQASGMSTKANRKAVAGGALQHSVPAIKLLAPFFKTMSSVVELRNYHRPASLDVRCINISPLQTALEEISKTSATIKNSKKLTLSDSSPFLLLEYSEERPLIMANTGMACQLLHYYRKTSLKDAYTPSIEFGMPYRLEPQDPSPFFGFGSVPSGQLQPALVSNLFRSPAFFHPAPLDDFVLCISIPKQEGDAPIPASFHLRSIPALFLLGQGLPLAEIPSPNSRTFANIYKNRIQLSAYRSFAKTASSVGEPLMRILKVYSNFPHLSEGSIRKWCKEYADVMRGGKGDHGTWRMKDDAPKLEEDELRQLITPEQVCLLESALAGQQLIADARFVKGLMVSSSSPSATDDQIDDDEASSQADTNAADSTTRSLKANLPEVRMSPWNLTSNFQAAIAGKMVLELAGAADPSHCGAGFSFLKLPQRAVQAQKMFVASQPGSGTASPSTPTIRTTVFPSSSQSQAASQPLKYTLGDQQQSSYKQDIQRIWEVQWHWLSNTRLPGKLESTLPARVSPYTGQLEMSIPSTQHPLQQPPRRSVVIQSGQIITQAEEDEEDFSKFLLAKTSSAKKPVRAYSPSAELVIERLILRDGQRIIERQVVTDQLVIAAYCRERMLYDRRRKSKRAAYKDEPIVLRKRKIAAAVERRKKKEDGAKKEPAAKNVKSRCGTCGQVGHMRTNRVCPRYAEYEEEVKRDLMRAADLPLEQAGLRIGEDGRICITKASLERVDAAHKQQLKLSIPVVRRAPAVEGILPAKKDEAAERRHQRATSASRLATLFLAIVNAMLAHPLVEPFTKPVPKRKYPLYYRLIARPRDLGTIRKKLEAQAQMGTRPAKLRIRYASSSDLFNDLQLIHSNSLHFNGPDHQFTQTASEMLDTARRVHRQCQAEIKDLEQQLLGDRAPPIDIVGEGTASEVDDSDAHADSDSDSGDGVKLDEEERSKGGAVTDLESLIHDMATEEEWKSPAMMTQNEQPLEQLRPAAPPPKLKLFLKSTRQS